VLASWGSSYRAEQISIGLADPEVSPYIKGRLSESGIRGRDAAGISMARTAAVRLLAAAGAFLHTQSYGDFAALVRHPDFEVAMLRLAPGLEPILTLDDYQGEHLPWRVGTDWSADASNQHDLALRSKMKKVWNVAREVLGDLRETDRSPIEAQAEALRRFLARVYDARDFDPAEEDGRVSIASLRCLAEGLGELAGLPSSLAPRGSMTDTIDLLLRNASNKSYDLPPPPARAGEPTIELMGWFELPLDDALALVVTGFQDGKVPESLRGDAYLPDRLRSDLGIIDNRRRLARDLYATELLVHSRERVVFISGRHNLAGDPLVPSRIVFHCAKDDVVPRVKQYLSGRDAKPARIDSHPAAGRELPRREALELPEVISVSAFRTYLESPYAYYLQHVLKLQTLDDRAREMDGAAFGSLAHAVLQRFGQDLRAREERDAEKIAAFLCGALEDMGIEIYGRQPLPAVQLQLEQLKLRLQRFAPWQARRRAEGWRIHAVEWQPEGGSVPLDVDDAPIQLRGRIDRIDVHEKKQAWAIWDYKTGDSLEEPLRAHRKRDGTWTDLQLPLYSYMTRELLAGARHEELGYIAIGRDDESVGFWPVEDWRQPKDEYEDSDTALRGGVDRAREIVRAIRRGELFELGDWQPYDEIFAAIGGVGLMESSVGDGEEAR